MGLGRGRATAALTVDPPWLRAHGVLEPDRAWATCLREAPRRFALNPRAVEQHRARGDVHADGLIGVMPADDAAGLAVCHPDKAIALAATQLPVIQAVVTVAAARLPLMFNLEHRLALASAGAS